MPGPEPAAESTMHDADDQSLLLAHVRDADQGAFAALVRRHVDLVFGSACRLLGDRGAAEEVAQNVFTTLARKAPWLTGQGGLAGWLYRTTVLEARLRQRTEARRRQREQTAIALGATMQPDDSLLKSLVPLLDDGLMELGAKDRHALIERFFEGKSFREVGASLGAGEDAAQKRVARALEQLARFFRRRGFPVAGAGVSARVLETAGMVAPPGLATSILASIGGAAGAVSLPAVMLWIAKFMSLTKMQTAALCALLVAAPVALQWHAATAARAEHVRLETRLHQAGRDLEAQQRQHAHGLRRQQALDDSIADARRELARLREVIATARRGRDAGLYLWSEESDYVRVPKSLAKEITLSSAHELPGVTPAHRIQQSPVFKDGSLSEALDAALGVTEAERDGLAEAFADLDRNFKAMIAGIAYVTNAPPFLDEVRDQPSRTLIVPAAPLEESERLREQFRARLVAVLGEERANVFWTQAQETFRKDFNDFGDVIREQMVAIGGPKNLTLANRSRRRGESHPLDWGNSNGNLRLESLPEELRPFVQEWRARHSEAQPEASDH